MVFQDPYASLNPRKTVEQIVGPAVRDPRAGRARRRSKHPGQVAARGRRPQPGALEPVPARVLGRPASADRHRARTGAAAQLIVCDEPVSALDVSVQAQILNLLRSLQNEFDLTYVFISHDLSVMRQICTRIAVMYLGRVVELADSEEIFEHPKHPYTAVLISAVPRLSSAGDAATHRRRRRCTVPDQPAARRASSTLAARDFVPGHCDVDPPELAPIAGSMAHAVRCHYPLERWPMTAEQLAAV